MIDRMYLNVDVRSCSTPAGLSTSPALVGPPIASTAPLARITDRFATAVHRFAEREAIPWVNFAKGQRRTMSCTSSWRVSLLLGRGVHRRAQEE